MPEVRKVWREPSPDRSPLTRLHTSSSFGTGSSRFSRGELSFHNLHIAQKLARSYQLPKDKEFMSSLTLDELLDQSVIDAMKVNSVVRHVLPLFV